MQLNSFIYFTAIHDLFIYFENTFGNIYQKANAIEKFREFQIGTNKFINFYSEFIQLASDLEYISEMLICKFKHKLTLRLQN